MASGLDSQSAKRDLATHSLTIEKIAQTPLGEETGVIATPESMDPQLNPDLRQALKIYSKHYLTEEDGIPGEGEGINDVMLPRLRGEDPNVKAVTTYAMKGDDGVVHGVAFVETYEINESKKGEEPLKGLVHLLTYAATEPPYNDYEHNAAFHAGIVEGVKQIDKDLGYDGNTVITSEVNSFRDYEGKPTSNKMDVEFEIKSGLKRAEREVYNLGGSPDIIALDGRYNNINILQIPYTPPELGDDDGEKHGHLKDAKAISRLLKNEYAFNGEGEPLFLTAENTDGSKLTAEQLELQAAFQKQLVVSVARDRGLTDKQLVLDARSLNEAGFRSMDEAYETLTKRAKGEGKTSASIPPRRTSWVVGGES